MNKLKNGKNKNDNFVTTFKVDADLELFIKNISVITFIENLKKGNATGETFTNYINKLIRKNMLDLLKNNNVSTIEEYLKMIGVDDLSIK